MATLYIVATPIGNLEDLTRRAERILALVDVILCEDTRVTKTLLSKYSIATATLSYHSHSKFSRLEEIRDMLRDGKNLALVSDAGTPGISDPGSELVAYIRRECREEMAPGQIKIESVPGPSALTAAFSIAGIRGGEFTFLGFLPHKKGRQTLFLEIAESSRTVVFYESSHRIMKTLASLKECLHESRNVTVCREITKVHEETVSGSAPELLEFFEKNPQKIRGEFVVLVSARVY